MNILYYILFIIISVIYGIYKLIEKINYSMIFRPNRPSEHEIALFEQKYTNNIVNLNVDNGLHCILFNSHSTPSWDNNIFIYCGGNASWVGSSVNCEHIDVLSKYGSIILFDYRSYGKSVGDLSENSVYSDVLSIWKYLTKTKNISPDKIIVYGFSLGSSIASKLVASVNSAPKGLILEAPFYSIDKMAEHYFPLLKSLVMVNFNNYDNIKKIKQTKNIPIAILHSKDDEIIPFEHAQIMENNLNISLHVITGSHNNPIYENNILENAIESIINA